MKRKLIEIEQAYGIECDNPNCDYKVLNTSSIPDTSDTYLNQPCPECGKNLLTEDDYRRFLMFVKIVNWLNRWFSWLTIFSRKRNASEFEVKIHDGIHLKEE